MRASRSAPVSEHLIKAVFFLPKGVKVPLRRSHEMSKPSGGPKLLPCANFWVTAHSTCTGMVKKEWPWLRDPPILLSVRGERANSNNFDPPHES